ncbi:MAG: restriction endonuclease subunit S [Actinobacteria bacterium QS_8_72_14]|nr:MAG: restriction endonuclease subunit S [Actinobacteria bacterium QS_8_72_14]
MTRLGPVLESAWESVALSYLVTTKYGHPFASETFNTDRVGVPVIRIRDVIPGRVQTWADETPATEAWVTNGDIVIGMDGDFNHRLWDAGDAAMNQRVCALRPGPRMDRRYLNYVVGYPLKRINETVHYTTVKHLSFADLLAQRVPVPPLETQRGIADVLDAETARIDTLIEKNNEAQRLAETKLREEIATAVTLGPEGSSRPVAGSSWAYEVNGSWDWAPYQYFAELGSGHTPSRSRGDLWENCTIPWVTTADVKHLRDHRREYLEETTHHLSEAGLAHSAARLLPARTVVLSRTASVGFSAIMAKPMATSQDFFTWTCDEGRLLPEYLLYVLRAMKFRGHFDRLMYGSTHQTIYFPDLVQLRGPVPPVPEQRAVVEYIRKRSGPVHRLADRVQRTNELLRLRRQALITAAVTGEIEV